MAPTFLRRAGNGGLRPARRRRRHRPSLAAAPPLLALALALALAPAPARCGRAPNFIPALSAAVWFSGRCSRNAADGSVSFDWLCTAHVNVQGASFVRARLNATGGARARFSATLDGAYEASSFYVGAPDDAPTPSSPSSFLVASGGLGPQPRLLQLRNVPEPAMAGVGPGAFFTLSGFETDGTAASPSPSARSIELVGDSISAGFGSRGSAARALQCNDVDINNSGQTYTYGQLLADAFSADLSNVAWSCKGMLANGCGDEGETMPQLYRQTFAGRAAAGADAWPFASAPSLLLINLGTNDMQHESPEFDKNLTREFVAFILNATVLYRAPALPVALMYGPMACGSAPLNQTLHDAIAEVNARGGNAFFVSVCGAAQDGGCGHPGVAGHAQMAARAAPVIAAKLNWALPPPLEPASP